jgi:hypothetical protein
VLLVKKLAFLVLAAALVLGLGACSLFNGAPAIVVAFDGGALYDGGDVFFDASYSTDPENDDLDFSWAVVTAPGGSATFDTPTSPSTWFGTLMQGDYEIKVTVTDGTSTVEGIISFYVSGGV